MRASTIFAANGEQYRPMPRMPRGPAKEVAEALLWLGHNRPTLAPTDREIAGFLGRSRRYVQKGLKLLEEAGRIAREMVRVVTGRGIEFVRQIRILFTVAANPERLTPRKRSGQISLPHAIARPGAIHAHAGAEKSSFEDATRKEQQAGVVGEGPDGPPPPPLRIADTPAEADPPAPVEDPAAVLRAAIATAKAADPAPVDPPPAEPPAACASAPLEGSLAGQVRGLNPKLDEMTRRMAAAGDPAALLELARLKTTPEASPIAGPAPAVESPEVDSTQPEVIAAERSEVEALQERSAARVRRLVLAALVERKPPVSPSLCRTSPRAARKAATSCPTVH